ncbi:MAG: tRNA (adenosine(37)-N6)-threonylcarbamoyltransferase complex transferase subunit TsaD [Candidatus Komeilibacteria bacterium]|nr:tRNA (adenosine(37)-N6)-threonylcarbamoyltransferase complex transferase subunit TsaD [Candidatus Komeilibacteria bacterium]
MIILGIETSCDDTAAALLEVKGGRFRLLKHLTASQVKLHAKYQGIVPEVAARAHLETIIPVIVETLHATSLRLPNAIAVTTGPGLITSLLIGVETAKALSFAWDIPLVGVNHIEGHIYSVLLSPQTIKFPAIALIVSGGHTELILMKNHGQYKLLGRTRDDAAGECFDKSARMLGLPYPGGPEISKRAAKGKARAFDLPRPMIHEPGFEFSFSGLKNAIRLLVENLHGRDKACLVPTNNLCASIEQAIVDVLVHKSLAACAKYKPKTFILAGGVSANKKLRQTLVDALSKKTQFLSPAQEFCMDNAGMIAAAAYHHIKKKQFTKYDKLKANANWELV